MYCTQCGQQNDDSAAVCSACKAAVFRPGTALPPPTQAASIPNYLVQSILVTLCCCLIPGIVAIVYAAQVNALIRAGDFVAARRCSTLAFRWSWAGFLIGILFTGGYFLLMFVGAFFNS